MALYIDYFHKILGCRPCRKVDIKHDLHCSSRWSICILQDVHCPKAPPLIYNVGAVSFNDLLHDSNFKTVFVCNWGDIGSVMFVSVLACTLPIPLHNICPYISLLVVCFGPRIKSPRLEFYSCWSLPLLSYPRVRYEKPEMDSPAFSYWCLIFIGLFFFFLGSLHTHNLTLHPFF